MWRPSLLIAVLMLAADLSAAAVPSDPRAFDHVLLPVFFNGERPGANGARWKTQLWIRNENSAPAIVVDASVFDFATDAELTMMDLPFKDSVPALGGEFATSPGYIEVPLASATLGVSRVRVVVEPNLDAKGRSGTPVTKFWGFIAITSNDDNQITVISPQ